MENEEVIRRQMENTRESLTEKLETLENKLIGSVQEATSAVHEAVQQVRTTVSDSVESVKDAVDLGAHIDRHPWVALGVSVASGYVVGAALAADRGRPSRSHAAWPPQPPPQPAPPGLLAEWEPEIRHLKGLAVGAALSTLRDWVVGQTPPHLAHGLRDVIDGITRKLGGEPLSSSN